MLVPLIPEEIDSLRTGNMTPLLRFSCSLLAAPLLAGAASAQATFTDLGSFRPTDMTPDGAFLAGTDASGPAMYEVATGTITPLAGVSPSTTGGISADGVRAAGSEEEAITLFDTAAYWDGAQWNTIGGIGGTSGSSQSTGYDMSRDGNVVVGLGWLNAGTAGAFHYDIANSVMTPLPGLGSSSSRANGVNADGSVVVGWDRGNASANRPAIWTSTGGAGFVGQFLGSLSPSDPTAGGECWQCSPDGSVIIGESDNGTRFEAFRYENGVMTGLGVLVGDATDRTTATAMSDDGRIIGGRGGNQFFGTPYAWIWTESTGMQDLGAFLTSLGAPPTSTPTQVTGISTDGRYICGVHGAFPFTSGFIADVDCWGGPNYCIAASNSTGTGATMGSSGTTSVALNDFMLICDDLPSNQNCIFYYGAGTTQQLFSTKPVFFTLIPNQSDYCEYIRNQRKILRINIVLITKLGGEIAKKRLNLK